MSTGGNSKKLCATILSRHNLSREIGCTKTPRTKVIRVNFPQEWLVRFFFIISFASCLFVVFLGCFSFMYLCFMCFFVPRELLFFGGGILTESGYCAKVVVDKVVIVELGQHTYTCAYMHEHIYIYIYIYILHTHTLS